jgi:hypothetical protein
VTPLRAWVSWLAEDAGIPVAVQGMFDLSEYEAQAADILESVYAK